MFRKGAFPKRLMAQILKSCSGCGRGTGLTDDVPLELTVAAVQRAGCIGASGSRTWMESTFGWVAQGGWYIGHCSSEGTPTFHGTKCFEPRRRLAVEAFDVSPAAIVKATRPDIRYVLQASRPAPARVYGDNWPTFAGGFATTVSPDHTAQESTGATRGVAKREQTQAKFRAASMLNRQPCERVTSPELHFRVPKPGVSVDVAPGERGNFVVRHSVCFRRHVCAGLRSGITGSNCSRAYRRVPFGHHVGRRARVYYSARAIYWSNMVRDMGADPLTTRLRRLRSN